MLADLTLSPHTARLFQKIKNGRLAPFAIKESFKPIPTRMEAILGALYTHYFLLVARGKDQSFLVVPWGEEPTFDEWSPPPAQNNFQSSAPPPASAALMEVMKSTTDPHALVSMLQKPTTDTINAILHPTFQRAWYEHLKTAEAKQDFRSTDPQVQYYLTRQGQMEFFVRKAIDPEVPVANQLKAMETAGKLKGYYSEKIQLMHENAPQTNVQQNFIMGTELTNRFRLFMEAKMKEREVLPAPDEAEVIDVLPEPEEDSVPDFLRMTA